MNWKSVLATALFLFLAASRAASAQEGTKKTGLEAARLFDEEGKALIDSLEKNLYGRDTGKALTLRGPAYVFSPTDPKDHLTTHFLHLPAGKARTARISLSFAEPEPSGSNLVVLVQAGGFATLQELRPRPNSTGELSFSQDVSVPSP